MVMADIAVLLVLTAVSQCVRDLAMIGIVCSRGSTVVCCDITLDIGLQRLNRALIS
jgi:hypothetical protein